VFHYTFITKNFSRQEFKAGLQDLREIGLYDIINDYNLKSFVSFCVYNTNLKQ